MKSSRTEWSTRGHRPARAIIREDAMDVAGGLRCYCDLLRSSIRYSSSPRSRAGLLAPPRLVGCATRLQRPWLRHALLESIGRPLHRKQAVPIRRSSAGLGGLVRLHMDGLRASFQRSRTPSLAESKPAIVVFASRKLASLLMAACDHCDRVRMERREPGEHALLWPVVVNESNGPDRSHQKCSPDRLVLQLFNHWLRGHCWPDFSQPGGVDSGWLLI